MEKLARLGVLNAEPSLDSVLDLTLENLLERRLQTIVFRKGLACSMYHARQLVTHGHVSIDGAKVSTPKRIITLDEEERMDYSPKSPLTDNSHPARIAASDVAKRVSMQPEFSPDERMEREPRADDSKDDDDSGDD